MSEERKQAEKSKTEISQPIQISDCPATGMKDDHKRNGLIGIIIVVTVLITALIAGIYNIPANRISRHLDLGAHYLEEKDYEQAIVEFEQVISIDPMRVDAYLGKAQAYKGIGDYDNAIKVLYEVSDLRTDNFEVTAAMRQTYLDYAYACFNSGNYDQVVEICHEANDNLPDSEDVRNVFVRTYLAYAQDTSLDSQKSIAAYLIVLELDELNIEAYLELAELYYLQGNENKAVEILSNGWDKTRNQRIYDRLSELGYGDIEWTIKRIDNSITDENGNTLVRIYYDLVYTDNKREIANKINTYLENVYEEFLTNDGNKEKLQEYLPLSSPEYPLVSTVEAEISYENEQYISIKWKQDWFMGGVYNIDYSGVTFSIETGEPVNLQDIYGFEPNVTLAYLKFAVMEYVNNNMESSELMQAACNTVYDYNVDDFNFYLQDNYPVLCFETYELAAGAYGSFEIPCSISVDKDMRSYEKENLIGRWVSGDDINQFVYVLTFLENFQVEYTPGWGRLTNRDAVGDAAEWYVGTYDIQNWDSINGQGEVSWDMTGELLANSYRGIFRITFLSDDIIAIQKIDGGSMEEVRNAEGVLILGKAPSF